MKASEMATYLGRTYRLPVNTGAGTFLTIPVQVMDMRQRFGNTDAQVVPVHGDGSAWVEVGRLLPDEAPA